MKFSHPKISTNEIKNINSFRNKDFHQFNSKINKKPLTYKENTKQNTPFEDEELYCYKNKNKKNDVLHIQPVKSASIPSRKKNFQNNNILSEENLINLMNKYIKFSLNKNQNNKKKKLIRNSLTNNNLEENKENNIVDDKKKICMESLIKKGIIAEIKDLQKPKRETFKEKLTQKKKSFLEDIGIEPNNITSFQDSTNDNNKNKNNNIENKNIENNKYNEENQHDNNNINNYYYKTFTGICSNNKEMKYLSQKDNDDLYLYDENSSSDKECKKTPLKPKINQFEYICKIKKERSKIQTNPNYMSVQPENPTSKLKFMKISTPKIETTLNDSFIHNNEKKNKKINYSYHNFTKKYNNNNKINLNKVQKNLKNKENETKDELPFSHKKTYRSPEELNKYMKNKKIKNKEIEEQKIYKKNKELFIKYKNLCTLNNNNCYKKYSPDYYNTISIKYKTHTSGFGFKDKKRENNKIILGNESFKNNNSTLIDANEYYLNILESKKLIIKNIYSKTETHFYNNKNNDLKNIDEYFNNKKSNNIQNNNLNENNKKEMIRKISKKINDTLIKAKKIFAVEENNNEDSINYNNINDNKENNIINKNKEININRNEEIKKNENNNNKDNTKTIDKDKKKENEEIIEDKNKIILKEDIKNMAIKDSQNKDNNEITNNKNITNNKEKLEIKENEKTIKKEDNKEENIQIKPNNNNIKENITNEDNKEKNDNFGIKENILNNKDKKNNNNAENEEKKENKVNKDIKDEEDIKNKNDNNIKEILNIDNIKDKNMIKNKDNNNLKKDLIDSQKLDIFTDIINITIKKNIFMNLYKYYIKIAIFEHYFTSISYFIAFCKKYPFIKIREFFYKSKVFLSLKELINPFIKHHIKNFFDKLKEQKKSPKGLINNFIDTNTNNNNTNITKNEENKIKGKLIENDNIKKIDNLIEENSEDKINNVSDFYNNALNTINTSKEIKINNDNKPMNLSLNEMEEEKDISAEKDKDNKNIIEWINIDSKNNENKENDDIKNNLDNINNHINKKIIINDENKSIEKNDNNNNNNNNEIIIIKNNTNNDKSRNDLAINNEQNNIINEEKNKKLYSYLDKIDKDILINEILENLLFSEITSEKTILIPRKKFKYEMKLKKSRSNLSSNSINNSADNLIKDKELFDISGLSQLSLGDDLSLLNDSIMSTYTEKSFFNKTILDKKKLNLLYFYQKHIAPKLIKLIKKEIINKYDRIYNNISKPYINNSDKIMMSLILQDADMLRDNFKCQNNEETISDIIDKDNLIKKFEPINKKIREIWKIKENIKKGNKNENTEYNYLAYDENLNKCLIDCCIELINCERKYGENGNPLIWSSRLREIEFKYEKNDPYKLADFVCRNLYIYIKQKVGLICDNYECLSSEQINSEREKRLVKIIRNELDEGDYLWKNLEMEETQLKVEVTDNIMDQLYNEIIEILEHIQLNRNKSELYHNKSIYACEEMPKLSFQQTTTENIEQDDNDEESVNANNINL